MKPKAVTRKRRTEVFSTKEQLLAALLQQCETEYEETFGHPWSAERVAWVEDLTRRWRTEVEAWRVMKEFREAAAKALDFFESRGLERRRPDHGLLYAYKLHKLVTDRRRFLGSLMEVEQEYEPPPGRRHWLAWIMNVAKRNAVANASAALPYGRRLNNRELAILSILMTQGKEVTFKRNMTIGDAIEEELYRMTLAATRAPRLMNGRRKKP